MGYVGNEPSVNFTSFAKQDITGDGGANYTLTYAVANANEIEVFVNNVRQEPTEAYTVSGTALTMTGNVASTDDFYVIYLGKALQTTTPPDGSVTSAKLDTNIAIDGDLTVDTSTLKVDSTNNRVGIGTASPSQALHVAGGNPAAVVESTTSSGAFIKFENTSSTGTNRLGYAVHDFVVDTNGSERMRIDSSGNLLVGKTSADTDTTGIELRANNLLSATRTSSECLFLNRKTDNGTIINLNKDGTSIGEIGVINGNNLTVGGTVSGHGGIQFGNNNVTPMSAGSEADNLVDLGASNLRYDDIYATNPNISTSDRNEKQDIEELTEAEQRVAVACKGLMRKYRWRDSVAKKGDNARTHFGIIAQDLQDAFTAEGLDAGNYAMFTSNTWWEKEISVDAVEADEENGIEAKDAYTYIDTKEEATEGYTERTRLGVRYSELLAFIISAL